MIEQLEGEAEQRNGELDDARQAIEAARLAAHEVETRHAAETGRLQATAEQLDKQLAERQGEVTRLRAEVDSLHAKLEEIGVRERAHIASVSVAQAAQQKAEDQMHAQKTRSGQVITDLEAAKGKLDQDLSKLRKECRRLTEELGQANGALNELRTEAARNADIIRQWTKDNDKKTEKSPAK